MREYRREPLRNGEPERLLAACRTDLERALITVLLETGIRLGELCQLSSNRAEFDQVNWGESRLRVRGKGDKFRVLPLSPAGAEALLMWLRLRPNVNMTSLKRLVQRKMQVLGKRAGIERPVFPHLLRHTFAVRCLRRNISLRTLQLLLGHSTITTTEKYLNLSPEEVCEEFAEKW